LLVAYVILLVMHGHTNIKLASCSAHLAPVLTFVTHAVGEWLAGRATAVNFGWMTNFLSFPVTGPCFLSSRTRPGLCCSHPLLGIQVIYSPFGLLV